MTKFLFGYAVHKCILAVLLYNGATLTWQRQLVVSALLLLICTICALLDLLDRESDDDESV